MPRAKAKQKPKPQQHTGICKQCGCTSDDCTRCVEKTGQPCHWVSPDLCSACFMPPLPALLLGAREALFNLAPGYREADCFGQYPRSAECCCTACLLARAHARLVSEGGAA